MPRVYTETERARVLELLEKGRSLATISRVTGVPKPTIWHIGNDAGVYSRCQNPWAKRRQAAKDVLIERVARETGYPAAGVRSVLEKAEAAGYRLVFQNKARTKLKSAVDGNPIAVSAQQPK
jgi:hypothetical protein